MRELRGRRLARRIGLGVLLAFGAVGGLSCVEGPFEPWDPARDDRPYRFLAGAGEGTPLLALTPGRVASDSTLEIDLRLREAPLVAGLAFEIVAEAATVALDSMLDGTYFVPSDQVTIAEFAPVPGNPLRWVGVVAVDSLRPGVGGSGVLGTLRVRRRSASAFLTELRFDTLTTAAYGPDGARLSLGFAAGRVQHTPRPTP